MKKLMKSLMLFAAAAMALTSCQNEEINEGIKVNETFTVNFVADAPASRTSVNIEGGAANFSWGADEQFQFIQSEVEQTSLTLGTGVTFTNNAGKGEISATFAGDAATSYNFTAVYPAKAWVDGTEVESSKFNQAKLYIKDAQTLVAGSFDPDSDLMVSKVITGTPTEVSATAQSLQFTRLVAIAEINLKLLQVAEGEKILGFTFEAGATDELAGRAYVNLETAEVVDYTYYGATNTIKLTNADGIEANDESVKVYFTCIPTTIAAGTTVTFTVTTDKAIYTKEATLPKDLTFEAGKVKAVGIDMEDAGVEYLNDMSGDYIIVTKRDSGNFFYMTPDIGTASTARLQAVDTGADTTDAIEMNEDYKWTITKSGNAYTIGAGSEYIAWTSGNSATLAATGDTMNITKGEGDYYNISLTKDGTRILQLNNSTSSNWFAFYTSTQARNLYLIPFVEDNRQEQTLSFPQAEYTITMGDEFSAPTVSGAKTTVTYTSSNTAIATVDASTGAVTIVGTGTTTITATAEANETYKRATASYDLIVESATPDVIEEITIEEFLAKADANTTYQLTGEVTGTYNTTFGNFYLQDATGKLQIYGTYENGEQCWTSKGLKDGDIITLQGKYGTYNGNAQIKNAEYISHYSLTVTPASSSIGAEGGNITIAVSTTSGEAITASIATNDFATLSYNGGDTATVTFEANEDVARSVEVTFQSKMASETITLSQASGKTSSKYYVKVTEAPTDWSGTYLIVFENSDSQAYVFNGVDSTNDYVTAIIENEKIAVTDELAPYAVTIASMTNGYSIKVNTGSNSGKYMYGTSGSNKINFGASANLNTITYETDHVHIVSNTSVLRFNNNSGNYRFRYFKSATYSSQKAIQLYKLAE